MPISHASGQNVGFSTEAGTPDSYGCFRHVNQSDKEIEQIQQTQDALRDSIEEAKRLADKAHRLLQKHKKTVQRQQD